MTESIAHHSGASSPQLSVIIITLNEEINLPACIESLRGLNCRIYVVDSGSADRTVEIAESERAIVVSHPFHNYAAQRNWAQENLNLDAPWILHLDADERLTPGMVRRLNELSASPDSKVAGYLLRKRTIFMGKWIRHGGHYPSYHLRAYRRGLGRCEDRLYDQHFVVDGRVERLDEDYLDVVGSSLRSWTARHGRWAELEAHELTTDPSGRQVTPDLLGNPIERRRWWRGFYGKSPLFLRAFLYWFYRYFLRCGFLDGKEGLIFHFLQGFWFRFLVDAMIWEKESRSGREGALNAVADSADKPVAAD